MKNLTIKNTILMFISLVIISVPFSAFATDQWNETPQFSHDGESDTASIESSRF